MITIPAHKGIHTLDKSISVERIYILLENGALLHGPSSDTYATYFWAEDKSYVLALDSASNLRKSEYRHFPRNRTGLIDMVFYTCFSDSYWQTIIYPLTTTDEKPVS